jgi:hypothetical protein
MRVCQPTLPLALVMALVAGAVRADAPRLTLELNGAETIAGACRISLLVDNALPADLHALAIEAVVFDRAGAVTRLLTLDLQEAPKGRPRLRQFDLAGLDCAQVGRVLVNAVTSCTGLGLEPAACLNALDLRSRVAEIEVIG